MAKEEEVKDQVEEQAPVSPADFWKQQYEEAAVGSGNTFLFFKAEKTRVRLIGLGNDPSNWVRRVESEFQGTKRYQYLTLGFRLPDPGSEEEPALQAIVFSKGAWGSIANMMIEGYDLFSPEGFGLTVNRMNNNNRISYNIIPAPVKVPIPEAITAAAKDKGWDFYLAEHAKMQAGRGSSGSGQANSIADQIVNAPASASEW